METNSGGSPGGGFLRLGGRRVLVAGVANRKSVAFHIAKTLAEVGALPVFSVLNQAHAEFVGKSFPGAEVYLCDVSDEAMVAAMAAEVGAGGPLHGLAHSLAFANYADGIKPFHETPKADFLQAVDISCFSLISMARHLSPFMAEGASIITISISTTRMAAESYGYMAPIKAALDSSVCFLAKSLSGRKIRVNAIGASLLRTSASAGIPGYVEPYLFAEKATLRGEALRVEEVADAAAFLLSPRSSGVNAQTVVVDAGMAVNFFDKEIVHKAIS